MGGSARSDGVTARCHAAPLPPRQDRLGWNMLHDKQTGGTA
jgi:hypothetical protein